MIGKPYTIWPYYSEMRYKHLINEPHVSTDSVIRLLEYTV